MVVKLLWDVLRNGTAKCPRICKWFLSLVLALAIIPHVSENAPDIPKYFDQVGRWYRDSGSRVVVSSLLTMMTISVILVMMLMIWMAPVTCNGHDNDDDGDDDDDDGDDDDGDGDHDDDDDDGGDGDPDGADFVAVGCEGSELYPACQESQLGGLGVAQPQAATIAMVATTILLAQ